MRKLLRKIAHYRMRKAGHTRVNKEYGVDGSYFSKHWREFC